jgi:hypothetical protein
MLDEQGLLAGIVSTLGWPSKKAKERNDKKSKIFDKLVKFRCNCKIYVRGINEFNHDILMKEKNDTYF